MLCLLLPQIATLVTFALFYTLTNDILVSTVAQNHHNMCYIVGNECAVALNLYSSLFYLKLQFFFTTDCSH